MANTNGTSALRAEGPSSQVIYIDPPTARRILAANTRNRPISEVHVQRLMREMTSGRWQYNGEAIKWSADSVLLDGQHRLTALSRLDDSITLPFLVVRGLPSSSQDTMDQGRKRSAADQININGLVSGNSGKTIAGAVRVYVPWVEGRLFTDKMGQNMSTPEVVNWAEEHPIELSIMEDAHSPNLRRAKGVRPSVTLAVFTRFRLIDGEAARAFESGVCTGAGLSAGDPILTLRDRFDRISEQKVRTSDRDYLALYITAWNAWREGRTMQKFQKPAGGAWTAETFPEPK